MQPRQISDNQERLEILLAMAIAFRRQPNSEEEIAVDVDETATQTSVLEQVSSALSALNDADLTAIREKVNFYEALDEQEKLVWQARVLSRLNNQNLRLDKDVHYTQIAKVLEFEPGYICNFILSNLSEETRQNIAATLSLKVDLLEANKAVNPSLQQLLRRRFLTAFVAREELIELKPLDMLSGSDVLKLLQQLGRNEIALVCRGIKEIENLAPFLRQFPPADAKVIVEEMVKLRTVERNRIEKAENLVHQAWQAESDSTVVVQHIGLKKLAAALVNADDCRTRFVIQKMPLNLSNKLQKMLENEAVEPYFATLAESEAESVAKRFLLEKLQINQPALETIAD